MRCIKSSRNPVRSLGLVILTLCLRLGGAFAAQYEIVVVDFSQEAAPVPPGWELKKKTGTADYALIADGDGRALRLRTHSASFALQTEVDIDLTQTPILQWRWKVAELPQGADFRDSARDDQAAQLFVMFSPDVLRTEVIAYIWDSTAPKGTIAEPTFPPIYPVLRMRAVVVESGEANKGKWMTVTRNVVEDYKRLFGGVADHISGIRIQINSQHTKSRAESYWGYVKMKAQP